MARKPPSPRTSSGRRLTDEVQLKLRFQEGLRQRLERRARQNGRSLNAEIIHRLHESFGYDSIREEAASLARGTSLDTSGYADTAQQMVKSMLEMIAERYGRSLVAAQRLSNKAKDESK
jgi:Arc-like DNA binding domain